MKNVLAGRPPYQDVEIRSRGELLWVMQANGWSVISNVLPHADLRGVNLHQVNLGDVQLNHANLQGADCELADLRGASLNYIDGSGIHLTGAHLENVKLPRANLVGGELANTNLSSANLWEADLTSAQVAHTNLTGAWLTHANLTRTQLYHSKLNDAHLELAMLDGAYLEEADLRNADLRVAHLDSATNLAGILLSSTTLVSDVVWNSASLTRIAWSQLVCLGDETKARNPLGQDDKSKPEDSRLRDYEAAGRAYRQLAIELRGQGLSEDADRYAYRGHLIQREVFRRRKQWPSFTFSWFLYLISGYGYRLWHILVTYAIAVLGFTLIYWSLGVHSSHHEPGIQALWDSFLVSLSAIHGRATFEQLGAWSSAAWTAAVESVVGIIIEGVFVAMLIQRFFAR